MGSSSHLWFCACKTATLGLELQVSAWWIDPTCGFCMQNSDFWTRITSLYGSQTLHLWFSACKTACLASELQVYMGPSPHLWFLHAKQRLMEPELQVSMGESQTSSVGFVHENQRRFWTEWQVSMGSKLHLWFFCMQNSDFMDQNYKSLWVPDLICGFCMKTATFWTEIASLYGS